MKAIIAHPNLDFDALASMVAAKKLYPDAVLVTVGKLRSSVKDFIAMHGDFIEIRNYIDKKDIDTLIMVDTRSKKRLQDFAKVLDNEGVKVIVYDHHDHADDDVDGAELFYAPLGANVTQLVECIQERDIKITAQEATVFALGIYDDTGSLRFSSTTPRDMKAAAWLLEQGANLSVISEYSDWVLGGEQSALFQALLRQNHFYTIQDKDILIATGETDHFVTDLGVLTMKLKDTFSADAVFTIVKMEKRIYLVGRSSVKEINIRDILAPYDGRGHIMAASGMIKELSHSVSEIADELCRSLEGHIAPSLCVRDIMTAPVKTINADVKVSQVGAYMVRYGHSGYPVMEDGKLIGIISQRDVEKCEYHGLGGVPVKGYMSHHVLTCAPSDSIEDARRLMAEKNIGRLPVIEDGQLVGIITRTDILQILYGAPIEGSYQMTFKRNKNKTRIVLREELASALPEAIYKLLLRISDLADREGIRAFLVGGFVRDLLMGYRSVDLDIVVEGNGMEFGEKVAAMVNGSVSTFAKFQTASVAVNDLVKIDIASARTEFYEYPAARPKVEQSTLRQDLFRRDFTVNAMALSINRDSFGTLIDYYNGCGDLEEKKLRVLHNLSFVEDPTRIIRALRFCARYDFAMSDETKSFARKAVEDGVLEHLSRRRIWHETELALGESCAYRVIASMEEYGIWQYLFPGYAFREAWEKEFAMLERYTEFFGELVRKPNFVMVRFLLIAFPLEEDDLAAFCDEVQLSRVFREAISLLHSVFYQNDGNLDEYTDFQWYRAMSETPVEVVIAAYIKTNAFWRERILHAFRIYRTHKILCSKQDIREMEGYERGQLNDILSDLLAEKQRGGAKTVEEELAYVRSRLAQGKYKGDVDV